MDSCDSLKLTLVKSPSANSAPEMSKPAAELPSILHWRDNTRGAGEAVQRGSGQRVASSPPRASRTANLAPRSPVGRAPCVGFPGQVSRPALGCILRWACLPHCRRRELAAALLGAVDGWKLVLDLRAHSTVWVCVACDSERGRGAGRGFCKDCPRPRTEWGTHRCSRRAVISEGWQHALPVQVQAQCQA